MKLACPVIVTEKMEGSRYFKQRQKCGKDATLYEVWGDSFCVRQELCFFHAQKARQEGFRLFEIIDVAEKPKANPETF